ncbi:hypothetical protein RN001_004184 [Aquatica leii]|uniref:Aminopeptidase n=1 Tax=Aquatica leii TaxID=1421715 RepID=A0AAN7Q5K5_9COLE|nr:hypothetical protein RN001_004184 [Aquatica leii]
MLFKLILELICVTCVWCQMEGYFLPKNVKPIRYNLTIAPNTFNVQQGYFYGSITIDIEALENTSNITLHAKELTINKYLIRVTDVNNNKIRLRNTTEDESKEFYILHLKDELKKGRRYIIMFGKYTGTLLNDKAGFFYAKYKDQNNNSKYMVVTEFEPTDARKTFPCFDEPHLKATFIVNIIRQGSYLSASNEELLSTRHLGNNLYLDTFKETVLMSTYILAFTVCEFKYTKTNDRIRLLVRPETLEDGSTEFMLDEAAKLLRNIETYTGIPYTLKKLDLLAIPEKYFLDGAMENWGLVIYNEKYLICSNSSSLTDKQKCATYSGHEFAHQWFGNLVTPKSWNYVWLSEGFAAYFQYFVTALVEPTWRLDEQYVVEELQSCFRSDIAPFTEPMNYIFADSDDFPSSIIYYYKASAVIRMTEHFLTHDLFVQSLRTYLRKYMFDSTVPDDLFNEYQKSINDANANHLLGGLTVHQILNPWVTNVGHPIVTVTRNYQTGQITFTQKTFDKTEEIDKNIWPIPITYYVNGIGPRSFVDTTTDFWLTERSFTIQTPINNEWILLNKHMIGYYRVTYDETNWKRITKFLQTNDITVIPPVNRAQLIDDVIFLSQSLQLNFELALNLTTYLSRETDYIPMSSFSTNFIDLDRSLSSKPEYNIFKNYVKWIFDASYKSVGLREKPYDTHIDKLLRILVAKWMCRFGDANCQNLGIDYLTQWQTTGILNIPIDLQFPLLCGAVQISNAPSWNFLLQQYYLTKDRNVKTNLIKALGCTNEKSKIINFMEIIYNLDNNISPEDRSSAIGSMMLFSDEGMGTVLDYLINTNTSDKRYKEAFSPVSAVVGLSSAYESKLNILKKSKRLIELPIFFYTDESLTEDELLFMEETSKWLQKYSKIIMERSSFA